MTDQTIHNEKAAKSIAVAMEEGVAGHPLLTAYLRSRGLSGCPSDQLFLREQEVYFDETTGKITLPAMIAPFTSPAGEIVCLSRTYLDENGDGKANVATPKKFSQATYRGATRGAAIRLIEARSTLGVAEGIETALAILEATGTAMWATGSAGGLESVVIPTHVRRVEVWADNDSNGVGQAAAHRLASRLYNEGYAVAVFIPSLPDKDWLDVYREEGAEALWDVVASSPVYDPHGFDLDDYNVINLGGGRSTDAAVVRPVDVFAKPNVVLELNKRHFVVSIGGKTCIATEKVNYQTRHTYIELSTQGDFRLLYQNEVQDGESVASIWLCSKDRRQYEGIVFAPGKAVPGYYNLFRGFTASPQKGKCYLLWQHLFIVVCRRNRKHYTYLRKWLAHLFQRPGELPGVAIVIRGKQGTGKTIFVDFIGDCLGQHYLVLTRMEQLTGRFNSHLKDILLVSANEALWGGDKAGEGALKAMITDKSMAVEFKGKDIITVDNYKRLIVTSNEDWPVPMGMDDRRFLVLETSDEHKEEKGYFAALAAQMENGGKEAMMYDLLREDLSDFDVRTAPRSRFGFEIKMKGAEPILKWWYERLYEGKTASPQWEERDVSWNPTPTKDALHHNFLSFCNDHKLRTLDKAVFGKKLATMLPGGILGDCRPRQPEPSPDDTVAILSGSGWKVRPWRYNLPPLEECRKAFQILGKAGPEIWPEEPPADEESNTRS